MLELSEKEKETWLLGEPKFLKLEFDDGNIITNEELDGETLVIEQVLCDEDLLQFGKCSANTFSIDIKATTVSYKGKWVKASISTYDNDGVEYTRPLGKYKIDSDKRTSDKIYKTLLGYDIMSTLDSIDIIDWYSKVQPLTDGISYTFKKLRDNFFKWLGIKQVEKTLPCDDCPVNLKYKKEEFSMSALGFVEDICEINGCFGNITFEGKFDYVFIDMYEPIEMPSDDDDMFPGDDTEMPDQNVIRLTKDDYFQGDLDYEDFKTKPIDILKIKYNNSEQNQFYPRNIKDDEEVNVYTISDNLFINNLYKGNPTLVAYQTAFWNSTREIVYTPATIKTQCHFDAELGDTVLAYGNADVIRFPILKRTISGINNLCDAYECRGSEEFYENIDDTADTVSGLVEAVNAIGTYISVPTSDISIPDSTIVPIAEVELEAGIWVVAVRAMFEKDSNGSRRIGLRTKGDTSNPNLSQVDASTHRTTSLNATSIYRVNNIKTYELCVFQDSGRTLIVNAGETAFIKALRII